MSNLLPMRLILINQQSYKGIIKLDTILYADNVLLSFELYNFKTQLTNILIESLESYTSNREFFKTLPVENIFKYQFSLSTAESFYQYLIKIYETSNLNDNLVNIQLSNLNLWLSNQQIFSIINVFQNFIMTHDSIKVNIAIFRERQNQNQITQKVQEEISELKIETQKNEEPQIIIDTPIILENDMILLNDMLKLSPNNIITYFISKCIHDLISNDHIDIIEKTHDERLNTLLISFQPLIDFSFLQFTETGISSFLKIIYSFEFTMDEYINKIKTLLRGLIYISKHDNINEFNLSLKVLEMLIFIYTLKADNNKINFLLSNLNIDNIILSQIINSTISAVLRLPEFQHANLFNINIIHPSESKTQQNNLKEDEIRKILAKELYLLEIDKLQFIQTVFNQLNTDSLNKKGDVKLILHKESILNIDDILNNNSTINNKNNLLNYKLLNISEKQFEKNKIITLEYYKILKIANTTFQNVGLNSEEDIIISKYYTHIENILHQISNNDVESNILLTSTLNVLYQFIKPNINANVQIELYILYRIVIPFIYDIFHISSFKDYFC